MQLIAAQAVAGELTIDQAVAEMDRRTDRILEKRRWILAHSRSQAGIGP
jgi:multiple sugar transport system substrate-binding protein